MADSILTVTSEFEIFTSDPDWAEDVGAGVINSLDIYKPAGTASIIQQLSDKHPASFSLDFSFCSKEEEHRLVSFFIDRKGRFNRFWIRHPSSAFTLKATAAVGSSALVCERNDFDDIRSGYERIYIRIDNGDTIVRKIISCVTDSESTTVGLSSALDRAVTKSNHTAIGKFVLVRFDEDTMKLNFKNMAIGRVSLKFFELPEEWGSSSSSSSSG